MFNVIDQNCSKPNTAIWMKVSFLEKQSIYLQVENTCIRHTPWYLCCTHGRPQKFFQGGGHIDIFFSDFPSRVLLFNEDLPWSLTKLQIMTLFYLARLVGVT